MEDSLQLGTESQEEEQKTAETIESVLVRYIQDLLIAAHDDQDS